MEEYRNPTTPNAVGFCLLPHELIQSILLSLALPDIIRTKLLNKSISSLISDHYFIRECNSRSKSTTWLFLYMRRWRRDATLLAFSDHSDRWFKISVAGLLKQVAIPGEDLYFLTANGNLFLFASNTRQALLAVDLVNKTVKHIPPSPLGPRGTSSWRRSGMKLILSGLPGSGHFRFLFAELVENRPVVLIYSSETDTWRFKEANENHRRPTIENDTVLVHASNGPHESVVIVYGSDPLILRPRFNGGANTGGKLLRVYGDGYVVVVRLNGVDKRVRDMEVLGLSDDGLRWELISRVPDGLTAQIRRPVGVMMGCLQGTKERIRIILMSNFEGLWDVIWLDYDRETEDWNWIPVSECKMKGLNMAGITFSSSGLTLP